MIEIEHCKAESSIMFGILFSYFVLCVSENVWGIKQELELYTELDQKGDAILVRSKVPNLRQLSPEIANNIKSFCVRGRWRMYPKPDFCFDDIADLLAFSTPTFKCHNFGLGHLNATGSARYLGSSDTEIESISFYSEEQQLGSEVVVEAEEMSEIPFLPRSLITMGFSSWTVWAEKDFTGHSTCYNSTKLVTALNSLENPIGSVRQNCGTETDETIILNDHSKSSITKLIQQAFADRSNNTNSTK